MHFPSYQKNAQIETHAVSINPPSYDSTDARSAAEKFVDQQWRDAAGSWLDLGGRHPLSINRDSEFISSDPYN